MKKLITSSFLVFNFIILFSQVTITPKKIDSIALNVGGEVLIKTINATASPVPSAIMNSILVSNAGIVQSVTPAQIVGAVQNGVLSLVKGVGTGANITVPLTLGGIVTKLPFVSSFDLHSDFNFTNSTVGSVAAYTFLAPVAGYYAVHFQTIVSTALGVAGTINAQVVSSTGTLLATSSSVSLASALTSVPLTVRTILKLNANDQIVFQVNNTSLVGVMTTISGAPLNTYFTISQIR